MAETMVGSIKRASGWSIALGIIMIIAGIIAIFAPWEAGLVITLVVGWSAIFNGAAQIVFAFRTHGGLHIALEVILGIIYIIAGIFLLMHPRSGLLALTLVLASLFLIEGLLDVVLYFNLRPARGAGWVLFDGLVTLLLAGFIGFHWPSSSAWAIGTLVGVSMIMSGVARVMMSLGIRKLTQTTSLPKAA